MGQAVLFVIPSRYLKFKWRKNYWWRYLLLFTSSYPNSTLWDLAVTLVTVTDTTQRRGCWSPLTAPCLGARLGINEDWKLEGASRCRQLARRKCGWRRGWKFTLMEIWVFRTAWEAPWIISYSCSQISISRSKDTLGRCKGKDLSGLTNLLWQTYAADALEALQAICTQRCDMHVSAPSDRILVDSLLKLKKSHWCRKLLLKRAVFEEALQKPWFIGSSSMSQLLVGASAYLAFCFTTSDMIFMTSTVDSFTDGRYDDMTHWAVVPPQLGNLILLWASKFNFLWSWCLGCGNPHPIFTPETITALP